MSIAIALMVCKTANWFGLLNVKNKNRLLSIVKVCRKVVGTTLNDLPQLYKARVLSKARTILAEPSHPSGCGV